MSVHIVLQHGTLAEIEGLVGLCWILPPKISMGQMGIVDEGRMNTPTSNHIVVPI